MSMLILSWLPIWSVLCRKSNYFESQPSQPCDGALSTGELDRGSGFEPIGQLVSGSEHEFRGKGLSVKHDHDSPHWGALVLAISEDLLACAGYVLRVNAAPV